MKAVTVASISGGKDSVAMCLELERRRWRVDHYLFLDSGVEYPECYDALDRFEKLTGRKVVRVKPKFDFLELAARYERKGGAPGRKFGYGWPSMKRRWCTRKLKVEPARAFFRSLGKVEVRELIGIAADESGRCCGKVYPLVKWGMTSSDCLKHCKRLGFYQGECAYNVASRLSCFCCPMASDSQINYLMKSRRDLFERIKVMESQIGEEWMCWRGRGFSTALIERVFEENGQSFRSSIANKLIICDEKTN